MSFVIAKKQVIKHIKTFEIQQNKSFDNCASSNKVLYQTTWFIHEHEEKQNNF